LSLGAQRGGEHTIGARTERRKRRRAYQAEERIEMMPYGESDYWVAQYRNMTEGSAQQQAHSVENPRWSLLARGTTLVAALSSSIARRGAKKKVDFDGWA
jgi:hypothetical protein